MKISLTLQPSVRRKNFVSTISTFSHHKEKRESARKSGKTKRENATLERNRGEFHFPLRSTVGMMRESEEHKKSPWQCWGWILDASSIHSVAIVEAWRVSSSVRAKIKIRKKIFSSPHPEKKTQVKSIQKFSTQGEVQGICEIIKSWANPTGDFSISAGCFSPLFSYDYSLVPAVWKISKRKILSFFRAISEKLAAAAWFSSARLDSLLCLCKGRKKRKISESEEKKFFSRKKIKVIVGLPREGKFVKLKGAEWMPGSV